MKTNTFPLLSALLFLFLLLMACGPGKEPEETEPISDEPISCRSLPDRICQEGLSIAGIGDYLAEVAWESDAEEEVVIADSLESQGGYIWLTRSIDMKEGRILIEGEFIDERVVNDTMLSESKVNRIRIETPSFRTVEGIRVGSTTADLMKAFPNADMGLIPLTAYGLMDVQPDSSHIHFLIPLPENLPEEGPISPDLLPADGRVQMIVIQ